MKTEYKIEEQVLSAQKNSRAADDLIQPYLPFIRAQTARFLKRFPEDGQDELSIAMFAFYEAAMAYRSGKGAFLKLAAATIRNRLIDYCRKEGRHTGMLSLNIPSGENGDQTMEDKLPDSRDELEELHDRSSAQKEIREFSEQLKLFGLSLSDIADNCPQQERTMAACMLALDYARQNPDLLEQLVKTQKLPLAQLVEGSGAERKTLERHRKYIVAILLAYTNGFEIIRGHLSLVKRKEASLL